MVRPGWVLCAALVLSLSSVPSYGDGYPARPVRIVIGFPAGASADLTARVLNRKLAQKLGQWFGVENRPGAGGNLAAELVARAPKDGYTLLMGTVANTINATLVPDLAFDFATDFVPITLVASVPHILVVNPALGVDSVRDLIVLAKSRPGQLTFGSSGVGTSTHLAGELFNVMAGVRLIHVPYTGSPQAVTDLIAGRIPR